MARQLLRNLLYYWRTNAAVVAGVAAAVAVLAGALLVGQSVRASLRDLLNERLGATDYVVSADRFFREDLARAFAAGRPAGSARASCPIIAVKGIPHQGRNDPRSLRRQRLRRRRTVLPVSWTVRTACLRGPGGDRRRAARRAIGRSRRRRPAASYRQRSGHPRRVALRPARRPRQDHQADLHGHRRTGAASASSRCGRGRVRSSRSSCRLRGCSAPCSSRVARIRSSSPAPRSKTNCPGCGGCFGNTSHRRTSESACGRSRRGRESQSKARASWWTIRSPRRRSMQRDGPAGRRRACSPTSPTRFVRGGATSLTA